MDIIPGEDWRPRPETGAVRILRRQVFGRRTLSGAKPMLDALVLALALSLFVVAIGYGYACERL